MEYLFGINHGNKKDPYVCFWAHNKEEEKEQFITLLNFIEKHLKKYPESHIYHFNHYEKTALIKLCNKHDTKVEQVNGSLREGKLVDLKNVVNEAMQVWKKNIHLKILKNIIRIKD